MRLLVFITLLRVYAIQSEDSKPRSVNLALETVLEFDNNDNSADILIIDKVKNFLDRIKIVIDKNRNSRRTFRAKRPKEDYTFSDFVTTALSTLISYDDKDLEDIVSIIDDEIRKYHYKGCKFYELVENYNVRRYMANQLDTMKTASAKKIRKSLKKIYNGFKNEDYDDKEKQVIDYINSLYSKEHRQKFKKILDNIKHYRIKSKRADIDLAKIVREGLRTIIFDHYSGLDYKTRRDLKFKLETFWKDFSNPEENEHRIWMFKQSKGKNNMKPSKRGRDESIHSESFKRTTKYDIFELTTDNKNSNKELIKQKVAKKFVSEVSVISDENVSPDVKEKERDEYVHDTNIAIDVEKDVNTPKSSKREKLTFITLYPEHFTFIEPKKALRTTKASHQRYQTLWNEEKVYERSRKRHEMKVKRDRETTRAPKTRENIVRKKSVKKTRADKMMAEHEKMKKIVDVEGDSPDHRVVMMMSTPGRVKNTLPVHEVQINVEDRKLRERNEMMYWSGEEPITRPKHKNQRNPVQSSIRKRISSDDTQFYKNRDRRSRKFLEADSMEGLSIASEEFHEMSFRKHNNNDTFTNSTKAINGATTISFVERLKDLEQELKNVKAKISDKNEVEIPIYDKLSFWEGTKKYMTTIKAVTNKTKSSDTIKLVRETTTTPKSTIKSTVKTKATPKITISTTPATTVVTTKKPNNTYQPVFRSLSNDSEIIDKKVPEKKDSPKNTVEKRPKVNPINITGDLHILDANNEIDNNTTHLDAGFSDIGIGFGNMYGKSNITDMKHLEKLMNDANPSDKNEVAKKKIYDDLAGILGDPNLEKGNFSAPEKLGFGTNLPADPLEINDDDLPLK